MVSTPKPLHTTAKPASLVADSGSSYSCQPMTKFIDGTMYCMGPMTVSGTRWAA